MASCAEFLSDVNVPLTLNLSADASTNLVEDSEPVTPTSRFRRRRIGRRTNQNKKVVPLLCSFNNIIILLVYREYIISTICGIS